MSTQILAILAVTVAIAAFVQGSSGLGFALIVAPVAGILDPALVPVFVLASMIPLNLYVAWRERSSLDLRGAGWITGARLAATPAGLAVLWLIPERSLGLFVGGATVLAAVASLTVPAFTPGRAAYVGAGAVTGLTETATGVGGPPLALVYQHRPPAELRSTVAACFLIGKSPPWRCCSRQGKRRSLSSARQSRSCPRSRPVRGSAAWCITVWTRAGCVCSCWSSPWSPGSS